MAALMTLHGERPEPELMFTINIALRYLNNYVARNGTKINVHNKYNTLQGERPEPELLFTINIARCREKYRHQN